MKAAGRRPGTQHNTITQHYTMQHNTTLPSLPLILYLSIYTLTPSIITNLTFSLYQHNLSLNSLHSRITHSLIPLLSTLTHSLLLLCILTHTHTLTWEACGESGPFPLSALSALSKFIWCARSSCILRSVSVSLFHSMPTRRDTSPKLAVGFLRVMLFLISAAKRM